MRPVISTGLVAWCAAEADRAANAARVADFGDNALTMLPPALGALTALQRLRLSHNQLGAAGSLGAALAPLQQLVVLALDYNRWLPSVAVARNLRTTILVLTRVVIDAF